MNIFLLSRDVSVCARAHVDKHVVKMPLEYAQMLSTAARIANNNKQRVWDIDKQKLREIYLHPSDRYGTNKHGLVMYRERGIYAATHVNHPCNVWLRESRQNWLWLRDLFYAVCNEYQYRYDKTHKTRSIVDTIAVPNLPDAGLTRFALAMPDEYKHSNCVSAYRAYYQGDKQHIATWKYRSVPRWYNLTAA